MFSLHYKKETRKELAFKKKKKKALEKNCLQKQVPSVQLDTEESAFNNIRIYYFIASECQTT